MDKLFPLLKSPAWLRNQVVHGLLSQPLPGVSPDLAEQAPQLLYALDQGQNLAYLPAEGNAERLSELHQAALSALRSALAPIDWVIIDEQRGDLHLKFLAFSGHFNAAECLLLPERLLEAHELLEVPRLLACTPVRGLLLVAPYDPKQAIAQELFVNICLEHYQGNENEPISPIIWGVEDGAIKDRLIVRAIDSPASPDRVSPDPVPQDIPSERKSDNGAALRYYTPLQIAFMTLFGTLAAGFYGLAINYKRLGYRAAFFKTLVAGTVVVPGSILLFLSLPGTPYDRLFPVLSAMGNGCLAALLQKAKLRNAFNAGAKRQTVLSQVAVIGLSLLLLLPLLAVFVVIKR